MRILVAEDETLIRQDLIKQLASFGECDGAADGRQTLEKVRQAYEDERPYQLICLDIRMPGMSGQEALREIRKLEEEQGIQPGDGAKIMIITALSDSRNIMEAFNAQCEAYLVKPVDRNKLLVELRKLELPLELPEGKAL